MNILLFVGIESYSWQPDGPEFGAVIEYCNSHRLSGALVKVFDGMQGEWYNGAFNKIHDRFTQASLTCVPFGFHYGNNKGSSLSGEVTQGIKYGQQYGVYCANMESSWDGQGDWASEFATLIAQAQAQKAFTFWVSTWANVADHNWMTNISHLQAVTHAFLPEVYNNSLYSAAENQYPHGVHIEPTFEISPSEFGNNLVALLVEDFVTANKVLNDGHVAFISLWEWQWAKQFPLAVDQIVSVVEGAMTMTTPLILSPAGCVCDVAQSNQLDNAQEESQQMCGPWSVAALKYAGLPGKGALASGAGHENLLDDWAEQEYTKYIGPNTISDQGGSSIENMHQFLHDAGNLHYWDISAISATSGQSSDIAHIKAALAAGYPILVTVSEPSVVSVKLGKNPYPWQPGLGDVNHIFPIIGVTRDGNWICADQLNSFEPWPQVYQSGPLAIRWATTVQLVGPDTAHPWLATIPSDDPTHWPSGFNAQLFATTAPPTTPPQGGNMDTFLQRLWNTSAILPAFAGTAPSYGSGIALAWKHDGENGNIHGPPVSGEYSEVDGVKLPPIAFAGDPVVFQDFLNGVFEWSLKQNKAAWHPFK